MPFGIGLPDIIEEPLNRVPGVGRLIETDEGRRRRRRRRRKPAPPPGSWRKKDKDEDGFRLPRPPTPGIVRAAAGDVAEIGRGFIPAARAVGKAGYRDVRAAQRAVARRDLPDRDDIRDFIRLAKWTVADAKGDKRKRPKTDSELLDLGAEIIRGWGRGIERALPNPFDAEDAREAARTWRDDPVFAVLDLLPVGTALARGGSITKRVPSLGARGAIRESYRPGAAAREAAREGREAPRGGIEPRTHRARIGEEDVTVFGRPWSRNPMMRGFQRHYDDLFELSPGLQAKRVGRFQERLTREESRRIKLATDELSAPVARLVYGRVGRMVGAFGLRNQMSAAERRRATALAYAFQMPREMDFDDSLRAVQDDLTDILDSGKIEVPRGQRMKQADLTKEQKQALTIQVADLQQARSELRRGDISEDEFRAALESLEVMSGMTDELGRDIMRNFRQLDEAEIAELGERWANRASMLPRRLATRGRLGLELADSPERTAWASFWEERFGPEVARANMTVADAIARAIRPNDPASFYAERVGLPSGELAADFIGRVGEDAFFQRVSDRPGTQPLIEGAAEAPATSTAFFSPLQRWVDESMPSKMQAGQLEAALRRQIPQEEFHNAGLANFFDQYERNAVVLKSDFQNFMANPLNAYNLREVHYMNTREADARHLAARYDIEHQGTYVSRDPGEGEYHEVLFELPDPTTTRDDVYRGTGRLHWDRNNVAVHFRFHVFDEDGKRKLLIEEIQSDWANDFRKEAVRGREYRDLTPEEQAEFDALRAGLEQNELRLTQARERLREAEPRSRAGEPGGDADYYDAMDEVDDVRAEGYRLESQFDALNDEFRLGNTPPPPLGRGVSARSSYLNPSVRWLTRYATENGVDEIIVVDRGAQLIRNAKTMDPRTWQQFADGDAAEVTRWLQENPHEGRSYISYETDIPNVLEREMGIAGVRVADAYEGQYRAPHDFERQAAGRMPGTVFKMTDEAKARAMRPRSLYQRQPNWDELPKGAVELFSDSQSFVRIFETGDVSTWIHELGHSALFDLGVDDLATLETHLAGGRKLPDWKPMDHERFARAFEDYVRRGRAPTRQLDSVFRKISAWIKQIWEEAKQRGIEVDPEVRAVFDRMFATPKADQGVWGYFPHRDFTEMAQQQYRGGVRPPAAGQTIGVPRLAGDTLQRNPNELLLYQTGRLSPDPSMLVDVFLRRLRFNETLTARNELWEMGQPLTTQPPRGAWLIRNPQATAERIRPEARAAVAGQETTLRPSRRGLEELEADLYDDFENVRQEMIARPGEQPRWASDAENVRWVPGEYVEARFGEVFEQRPRGSIWSALGLLTSLQRMTGIYGRPLSYIGGNIPFNTMALMASMPVSTLRNSQRTFRLRYGSPEARELYRAIASETGETRASGGLPEFYVRAQNRMQEIEQRGTQTQRAMADKLSGAADTPFRVTAFLNNARKRGFKTDDDLRNLIAEGGPELSDIRQLTREQLLDFDALNPTGRRMASNFLYLWPFIYASIKWPAMFAREYPGRAALGAELAQEKGEDEPIAIANLWKKHGIDLSTLNPVGPPAEIAEQLQTFFEDPTQMNLEFLRERLSPTLSFLVEGMSGGKKNALQNFIRQTIPGAAEAFALDPRFRGGKQFAEQDYWDYIGQRHGRFWPRGINPQVVKERVEQFRKDQASGDTRELEKEADRKKIEKYVNALGGVSDEDLAALTQSYRGWWAYQEAVDQKKDSTGQRKLTPVQSVEILTEIIEEHFPEVADELVPLERIRASDNEEAITDYAEQLKNYINAERTQIFNDYRSYASP